MPPQSSITGTVVRLLTAGLLLCAAEFVGATEYHVAQQHPQASDKNAGTADQPFKTISRAAELAEAGDVVRVHTGIYRERVAPRRGGSHDQPVVYETAPGQRVVVKGSELWQGDWQPVDGHEGVFIGRLDPVMFGDFNPFHWQLGHQRARPVAAGEPLTVTRGQVFVDGQELTQADTLESVQATAGSWIVQSAGDAIVVHFPTSRTPLAQRTVEISVRGRIFAPHRRGLNHIHVRGFIFEHCANATPMPQLGAVSTRSGRGWVIEGNTIRHARTIGLDCGSEHHSWGDEPETHPDDQRIIIGGGNLIRGNVISDNGLSGIAGWHTSGTRIIGNIVERNHRGVRRYTSAEHAGIKVHIIQAGVIEGNLVRDNDSFGIWVDTGYEGVRVRRNVVISNLYAGIFFELDHDAALVDHNVIAYTRGGDGIYAHDASGVTFAHNLLFYNSQSGAYMHTVTDRKWDGKPASTSRMRLLNNIIVGNYRAAISMPYPNERDQDNLSDHNVLMGGAWHMQTTAPPLDRPANPLFLVNSLNGALVFDAQADALKVVDPDEALARPLDAAIRSGLLDLEQWRALMGNDRHSIVTGILDSDRIFQSRQAVLWVQAPEALWKMNCPRIERVDNDFFGQPLPTENPLPGPFQNLTQGTNRLPLWPVRMP